MTPTAQHLAGGRTGGALPGARADLDLRGTQRSRGQAEGRTAGGGAEALGEGGQGRVPSVPTQVAQPGWRLQAGGLPVPVPCGCHADPRAVFADVVFDFTRLELQLRHSATQGYHDSWPHVPRVAHTLGEREGPGTSPHRTSTQSPLERPGWGGGSTWASISVSGS